MIERPFDLLVALKDKDIIISGRFGNNKEIGEKSGKLISFDIHINLVLVIDGEYVFFKGNEIISIKENIKKRK